MAETVTPSVRGAQRIRVVALLAAAGVVTGGGSAALAALVYDAVGLPSASTAVALAVTAVASALDLAGRPAPLDVGRQVPRLWGRVFAPETAAVLYGARLGVGPFTILTSWLWWAAVGLAVTLGVAPAAAAGAAFHVARVVTMVAVTAGARSCMPARMAAVRSAERRVARTAITVTALLAVAVGLAGCSSGENEPRASPSRASSVTSAATNTSAATTTTTTPPPPHTPETDALDDLLPDETLPGFTRVPDGRRGAGPLDVDAAAAAERDVQAERAVLTTRGFQRGVARVWSGPDDDTVYVGAYEFADAAGAAAYLADGRETLEARQVREFPVEHGFGFTQVDETSQGAFVGHAVAFVSDNRYVLVIVGGDGGRRTPDEARDVAGRVWDGLTPSLTSPDHG